MREPLVASLLLVDDRPATLMALEAILEPLGHRMVKANSGEEALKRVLESDFSAILLDVQMPGIDGFQTAALIKERERSRHIPILFLTAINKDAAYVFKGYEHGAVDYLLKPFDPTVLRSKVQVFVDLWLRGEKLKQREAQLREAQKEVLEQQNEHRYRVMLDTMPECVWAIRADGSVSMWNKMWTEYSGLRPEQQSLERFLELVHPEEREHTARLQARLQRDEVAFEVEHRLRRHDDVYRWHISRVSPERDAQGRLVGFIATATDVDEHRRARETAQTANRTKDEFLATVSHELRNPLNAILGWMRLLRSGKLDERKAERALATIERNTEAQLALVEDILDVSRIITGKLRIDLKPVSLSQVMMAAVDTVRPTADARGVHLDVLLDQAADQVSGDPNRLQQVVWNLLSNAIKFTPRGGRVEARSERLDSNVQIRVRDTGKGIPADFLPHVFDRFRQAEAASTRTQGGLGLGLAIVRHLVEAHGGAVSVDSAGEGQGTTFVVSLPLRAVQSLPQTQTQAEPRTRRSSSFEDAPSLEGLRVVVVDDEPDARELLGLVLGEYGADVTVVGSSDEAVQAVERICPDVLVSDLGLPKEDGFTLIKRVRALSPEKGGLVPAAALTGFARAEDGQRAIAAGFHIHVAKPVEPAELVNIVATLAGGARPKAVASR